MNWKFYVELTGDKVFQELRNQNANSKDIEPMPT